MRKILGGIAVLIVAVAVLLLIRHRHDAPTSGASPAAPAASNRAKPGVRGVPETAPTQREWARDVDPEGPLRLEGQVLDEGGAGVSGATVWLSSVPPRTAKSEADGTFAFDKVVGREYALTAQAGERVGGPVSYRLTGKSDPVVIRVAAGAKVAVEVTGDDGKPIANANVKLADLDERSVTTGEDGVASIAPVRPGWVMVEVSASGYGNASTFGQVGSAGATATLHVKLHKGVAVSGRVVDEAGKGIAKAKIMAAEAWWMPGDAGETTSDDKGDFTFAALAPGSHVLAAEDGEHAPARSLPVTVADHAVSGITITMKEGGSIAGKVVDGKGAAVPYATIRIAPKGEQDRGMAQGRQAVADNKGLFEVRGLPRAKIQVRATSEDASSKLADLDLAPKPALKDLSLVLDETGTIAGVVVDDLGKPVPEVQVTATADVFAGDVVTLAGVASATTDGAGAFTIKGLPDGAYRLRPTRGNSMGAWGGWDSRGTEAKAGDKNVKLTLPAPATLVGKIALEGGAVPKLASVQLGYRPATPVGVDGAFRIDDLEPGNWDVRVLGAEFAQFTKTDVKLEAGKTTDLGTLTVTRGRKLVGKVVDANGSPVAGARITVSKTLFTMEGADDQMDNIATMTGARMATSDQNGDFTVIGIPRTHVYAGAEQADKGRANPVDIPEGNDDPAPVTLALRGFGQVVGKVTSKGEPQGGVTITDTIKGSMAQLAITRTADDGSFTLAKVAEGTHVLNAMQMKGMAANSTSATVEITAGQTANVTIDIPVGTITVAVTVKPLPGAKLDAAQVFLLHGTVNVTTAKQLNDTFGAGGMQGMKFWFGPGKPMPTFDDLVAGDYSVCGLPITGNMLDPTFGQRLQEHVDLLRVYCKPVKVAPTPQTQPVELDLPAMAPLPDPKT
jgi:uncharacterized GH25 family protein